MGILDFFSPEAGQQRRQWLNRQEDLVDEYLRGYLGPAAQPIQSAAQIAGLLSPGADMMEAADASRGMWNADNPLDAAVAGATMLGATGMMFLPGNFNALQEGVGSVADDLVAAYDPNRVNAIIAYHGSPHTFDRFDISRIGTGEGAQAYGHGLYFAENEGVARSYRDALSRGLDDTGMAVRIDGTPITAPTTDQIRAARFGIAPTIDGLNASLERARRRLATASQADELGIGVSDYDMVMMEINDIARRIEDVRGMDGRIEFAPAGSMYQVQINADPSQLLDWDAPLSAQPAGQRMLDTFESRRQEVLRGIPEIDGSIPLEQYDAMYGNALSDAARLRLEPQWTGGQFYQSSRLVPGDYRIPEEASRTLREAGIPGIQYLDAGSRAAGDGSRNFVIFDDSIVDILKRYGIGAAAVGGGWALAPEEAQAAQSAGLFDPAANDRQVILDWLDSQGL